MNTLNDDYQQNILPKLNKIFTFLKSKNYSCVIISAHFPEDRSKRINQSFFIGANLNDIAVVEFLLECGKEFVEESKKTIDPVH